jgi:hypothetical protein
MSTHLDVNLTAMGRVLVLIFNTSNYARGMRFRQTFFVSQNFLQTRHPATPNPIFGSIKRFHISMYVI